MTRVAVVLSGCGYLDGSEIREAVISLLELDKSGAEVEIFAPNTEQSDVVNHLSGEPMDETRNALVESARIARGKVRDLIEASADNFDALILPGGYGVAKNLSTLASKGAELEVNEDFKGLILGFLEQKKPIGAICISPAVLVAAVREKTKATVTIGDDVDGLITTLGGEHKKCAVSEAAIDEENKIVSCPAYMIDEPLADIAAGIEKLVKEVLNRTELKAAA